jgi:hypothetical protein
MTARKQRPFVIYWNGMELLAGWPIGISHQAIRAAAIGDAIDNASLMLVLISASSNSSRHVAREIERADRKQIPTVPLRIENVTPSASLGYFVAYVQWIDIFPGPIEAYWPKLSLAICQKLNQKIPEKKDRGDSEIPSERSSDIKTIVLDSGHNDKKSWFADNVTATILGVFTGVALLIHPLIFRRRSFTTVGTNFD